MEKTAVVMGGSIAGLLVAHILAKHFSKVIIIDRDKLENAHTEVRKSTPQAQHAHVLLKHAQDQLEAFFPGFKKQIIAKGGQKIIATDDMLADFPMGHLCRFISDLEFVSASRSLFESVVRQFVFANSKIDLKDNTRVLDIKLYNDKTPTVLYEDLNTREQFTQETDLVVNCLGRQKNNEKFLENNGFGNVKLDTIRPYLGYSTLRCKKVSLPDNRNSLLLLAKYPEDPLGGVLLPCENDEYIATFYGLSKIYPPATIDELLQFAKNLRSPEIYEAIKNAEPLGPIKQFRKDENYLMTLNSNSAWPIGYLALGDTVCSLNPIYAQGITSHCNAAGTMAAQLSSLNIDNNPQTYRKIQQAICRSYKLPWMISVGEDLRWPGTEGKNLPWYIKLNHKFIDKIIEVSTYDQYVDYNYLKVLHMCQSPLKLLTPKFLWHLLRAKPPAEYNKSLYQT